MTNPPGRAHGMFFNFVFILALQSYGQFSNTVGDSESNSVIYNIIFLPKSAWVSFVDYWELLQVFCKFDKE